MEDLQTCTNSPKMGLSTSSAPLECNKANEIKASIQNASQTLEYRNCSEDPMKVSAGQNQTPFAPNGCQQNRRENSNLRIQIPYSKYVKVETGGARSCTPSPDTSTDVGQSEVHQQNSTYSPTFPYSNPIGEMGGMWHIPTPLMGWPAWCPQHNPQPYPLPMWPQTPPITMGHSSPQESNCSNESKNSQGSTSPHSQSCGSQISLDGSPSKGSPNQIQMGASSSTQKKLQLCGEESPVGKPFLKVDCSVGNRDTQDIRPPYGIMAPTNPVMMVPWYQYGPVMNSPWYQWQTQPFMAQYHIPPSPHSPFCSSHPSTPTTPSPTLAHSYSVTHDHSPLIENPPPHVAFQWSHNHKPLMSPAHFHSQTKKNIPPPVSGLKSRPTHWKSSGNVCPQKYNDAYAQQIGAWNYPNQQLPSTPTHNRNYHSPVRRNPLPFLGEPVRCLRRLTQLPDDRCALLPISPPLTPLQIDSIPVNIASLSHNQPAPLN